MGCILFEKLFSDACIRFKKSIYYPEENFSYPMNDLSPYVTMFPKPEDVFYDRVEEHAKVLFPLFSLDLSLFGSGMNVKVYMFQFSEDPYNENIPEATFNQYCYHNTLGFDVKGSKCSFSSNLNYFDVRPEWQEELDNTRSEFEKARAEYYEAIEKNLPHRFRPENPFDHFDEFPIWVQEDETPLDPDGEPMMFVGQISSFSYFQDNNLKDIYLFYSESHKLAVIKYQIT